MINKKSFFNFGVITIWLILIFLLIISFSNARIYNNQTDIYTFELVDDGFNKCSSTSNPSYLSRTFSSPDTNEVGISKQYLGLNTTYFSFNATVILGSGATYFNLGLDNDNQCSGLDFPYIIQVNAGSGFIYIGNGADYHQCFMTIPKSTTYYVRWIQNGSKADFYLTTGSSPDCSWTFATMPTSSYNYIELGVRETQEFIDNVTIEFNKYVPFVETGTYLNISYLNLSHYDNDSIGIFWNISSDLKSIFYQLLYRDNTLLINTTNLSINSLNDTGLFNNTEYTYTLNVTYNSSLYDLKTITIITLNNSISIEQEILSNILREQEKQSLLLTLLYGVVDMIGYIILIVIFLILGILISYYFWCLVGLVFLVLAGISVYNGTPNQNLIKIVFYVIIGLLFGLLGILLSLYDNAKKEEKRNSKNIYKNFY